MRVIFVITCVAVCVTVSAATPQGVRANDRVPDWSSTETKIREIDTLFRNSFAKKISELARDDDDEYFAVEIVKLVDAASIKVAPIREKLLEATRSQSLTNEQLSEGLNRIREVYTQLQMDVQPLLVELSASAAA